jgi:hypothetical protein
MQNDTKMYTNYQSAYNTDTWVADVDVKLQRRTVIHINARTLIDTKDRIPIQSGPKMTPVDEKQKSRCGLEEKHTICLASGTRLPAPPNICTTGNQKRHTKLQITDTA